MSSFLLKLSPNLVFKNTYAPVILFVICCNVVNVYWFLYSTILDRVEEQLVMILMLYQFGSKE